MLRLLTRQNLLTSVSPDTTFDDDSNLVESIRASFDDGTDELLTILINGGDCSGRSDAQETELLCDSSDEATAVGEQNATRWTVRRLFS